MINRTLAINAVDASDHPVLYTCYGLGSCIGLFITDRLKKISGGTHIPFPSSGSDGDLLDAGHLIHQLLNALERLGSNRKFLRAKLTGGAEQYVCSFHIGQQNAKAVLHHLANHNIYVAAADLGGTVSRTARFNSVTGELQISTSAQKKYSI